VEGRGRTRGASDGVRQRCAPMSYAEIERQTGRLELEAMRRGQPWIQ
jgi:hypothetical protein